MRPGPGLVVMALAFISGARRGSTSTSTSSKISATSFSTYSTASTSPPLAAANTIASSSLSSSSSNIHSVPATQFFVKFYDNLNETPTITNSKKLIDGDAGERINKKSSKLLSSSDSSSSSDFDIPIHRDTFKPTLFVLPSHLQRFYQSELRNLQRSEDASLIADKTHRRARSISADSTGDDIVGRAGGGKSNSYSSLDVVNSENEFDTLETSSLSLDSSSSSSSNSYSTGSGLIVHYPSQSADTSTSFDEDDILALVAEDNLISEESFDHLTKLTQNKINYINEEDYSGAVGGAGVGVDNSYSISTSAGSDSDSGSGLGVVGGRTYNRKGVDSILSSTATFADKQLIKKSVQQQQETELEQIEKQQNDAAAGNSATHIISKNKSDLLIANSQSAAAALGWSLVQEHMKSAQSERIEIPKRSIIESASPLTRLNPWISACDLAQPGTAPDLQGQCSASTLPVAWVDEGPGPPLCPDSCSHKRRKTRNTININKLKTKTIDNILYANQLPYVKSNNDLLDHKNNNNIKLYNNDNDNSKQNNNKEQQQKFTKYMSTTKVRRNVADNSKVASIQRMPATTTTTTTTKTTTRTTLAVTKTTTTSATTATTATPATITTTAATKTTTTTTADASTQEFEATKLPAEEVAATETEWPMATNQHNINDKDVEPQNITTNNEHNLKSNNNQHQNNNYNVIVTKEEEEQQQNNNNDGELKYSYLLRPDEHHNVDDYNKYHNNKNNIKIKNNENYKYHKEEQEKPNNNMKILPQEETVVSVETTMDTEDDINENEKQCLDYLGDSLETSPLHLCSLKSPGQLVSRLRALRLRHCCERNVFSTLHTIALNATLSGGVECVRILMDIIDLDALATRITCEYAEILFRFDCRQVYSIIHQCHDCKEAYRRWVCSTLVPYFAEPSDVITPIFSHSNTNSNNNSNSSTTNFMHTAADYKSHKNSNNKKVINAISKDDANSRNKRNKRNTGHTCNYQVNKTTFDDVLVYYTVNKTTSTAKLNNNNYNDNYNESAQQQAQSTANSLDPCTDADPVISKINKRIKRRIQFRRRKRIRPCLSVCQTVEQMCPYLLPADRAPAMPTQYAGEPTFLCLDLNIPEVVDQKKNSIYGAPDCCYKYCSNVESGICTHCNSFAWSLLNPYDDINTENATRRQHNVTLAPSNQLQNSSAMARQMINASQTLSARISIALNNDTDVAVSQRAMETLPYYAYFDGIYYYDDEFQDMPVHAMSGDCDAVPSVSGRCTVPYYVSAATTQRTSLHDKLLLWVSMLLCLLSSYQATQQRLNCQHRAARGAHRINNINKSPCMSSNCCCCHNCTHQLRQVEKRAYIDNYMQFYRVTSKKCNQRLNSNTNSNSNSNSNKHRSTALKTSGSTAIAACRLNCYYNSKSRRKKLQIQQQQQQHKNNYIVCKKNQVVHHILMKMKKMNKNNNVFSCSSRENIFCRANIISLFSICGLKRITTFINLTQTRTISNNNKINYNNNNMNKQNNTNNNNTTIKNNKKKHKQIFQLFYYYNFNINDWWRRWWHRAPAVTL